MHAHIYVYTHIHMYTRQTSHTVTSESGSGPHSSFLLFLNIALCRHVDNSRERRGIELGRNAIKLLKLVFSRQRIISFVIRGADGRDYSRVWCCPVVPIATFVSYGHRLLGSVINLYEIIRLTCLTVVFFFRWSLVLTRSRTHASHLECRVRDVW